MLYRCPICQESLTLLKQSWRCKNGHVYDLAKEGYVNLMPVQHKRSKAPGDSQAMMQARRSFLDGGYYQPLRENIAQTLREYMPVESGSLLDIGCGEGYYTAAMADELSTLSVYGLDVAKNAIRSAAKRYQQVNFCVASSYRLPFVDRAFDAVLRIYAPCDDKELYRATAKGGILLAVTPAPAHLKQLKALIYQDIKPHSDRQEAITGFQSLHRQRLSYVMTLDGEQAENLLQMTPFAWRASESVRQQLRNSATFSCDADFFISVYKKQDSPVFDAKREAN